MSTAGPQFFISPHCDDVLLSLPGFLSNSTQELHVIVCFSHESAQLEAACNSLHAALGVATHPLGFTEARKRGVPMRMCLRPGRACSEVQDDPVTHSLRRAIEAKLSSVGALAAWAPLMPVHIDHAIARVATEAVSGLELGYYEDYPYTRLFRTAAARLTASFRRAVHIEAQVGFESPEQLLTTLRPYLSKGDLAGLRDAERAETLWEARHGES